MKAQEIYHRIKAIAKPHHAYDDQMVAIAKWIEAEFEYKPDKHLYTIKCKICGKPFGDKLSLQYHYNEEHKNEIKECELRDFEYFINKK